MHALLFALLLGMTGILKKKFGIIRLKKITNDLLLNPGRTALVIFALVIGLWGVGTLLVSRIILQNDLKENFTKTMPPHVILTSNDFDKLDLENLRRNPVTESAEFRDLSILRIEAHTNDWIPLWLFGVEDFEKFNLAQIYHQKRPGPGTMIIERDGRLISNLKTGSIAKVRAGNLNLQIPVSGISFDPAQAPATQDHFIYAYVDKKTFSQITGSSANKRLILRFKNVKSKNEVKIATANLLQQWKTKAIRVTSVNIPNLNEHPHQWQLDTLLLLEGSIGLLAFLMAAVLVSQLMSAILAKQVRQIGVLKAIGASRFDVFGLYTAMILVFGSVASIIAIPLATISGFAFARFVASKLNFEILTTILPYELYIGLALFGLLMPVLFSLLALFKGVNISVHDALNDYGIVQKNARSANPDSKKTTLFFSPVMNMAWQNTWRRKTRLLVTVLTMAFGVSIFSTGFNIRESLWQLLTGLRESMKYDVQVVLNKQIPRQEALEAFGSIKNVKLVETWNGGRGELQNRVIATDDGVGIVALPYKTELFKAKLEKGRWLQKTGEIEVVMNQKAAEIFGGIEPGQTHILKLSGKEVRVHLVGIVWELDKGKIYMDQDRYDSIVNPDHLVNSLMFVAKDNSYNKVIELKKEIEQRIAPSSLDISYVMSMAERVQIVYAHLNIILTTIVFLAFTVLIVSALGMASATGINIMERSREIGVLRAIGATPARIYQLFVAEGMIVSAFSVVLGLILSWPLSLMAAPFFGTLMLGEGALLRSAFSLPGFLITLAIAIAFGFLASRIPARKAITVSTREALTYE